MPTPCKTMQHELLKRGAFTLTGVLVLLFAGSCDSPTPGSTEPAGEAVSGIIHGTLPHGGLQREYILYVPESYTGEEAVPLLLNFHGYTSGAYDQMEYGDFRPLADRDGFIIAHPMGSLLEDNTHWNVGGWTLESTTDDVDFTDKLITAIAGQYSIDSERIYSTGMSNGGFMSFLLACQLSGRIAAVASVTGSMTPETHEACNPQHPTPVMQIHGTTDEVVPYKGDTWTRGIDAVLQYWVDQNRCTAQATQRDLSNVSTKDGSTVSHILYGDCDNGVAVEHYKVVGGGHTWPGSGAEYPDTNYDMDASTEVWRFFNEYDINGRRKSGG